MSHRSAIFGWPGLLLLCASMWGSALAVDPPNGPRQGAKNVSEKPLKTVLVMHGGAGSAAMAEAARAISAGIPGAQLRALPGQTHGVSPKALAPVLEEFFS